MDLWKRQVDTSFIVSLCHRLIIVLPLQPPPSLKATGALSEREYMETEVISKDHILNRCETKAIWILI